MSAISSLDGRAQAGTVPSVTSGSHPLSEGRFLVPPMADTSLAGIWSAGVLFADILSAGVLVADTSSAGLLLADTLSAGVLLADTSSAGLPLADTLSAVVTQSLPPSRPPASPPLATSPPPLTPKPVKVLLKSSSPKAASGEVIVEPSREYVLLGGFQEEMFREGGRDGSPRPYSGEGGVRRG